jgi:hypothetical protein
VFVVSWIGADACDRLAHLRAIAQYFLDEAEAERRKAKPCERVINQSLERTGQ